MDTALCVIDEARLRCTVIICVKRISRKALKPCFSYSTFFRRIADTYMHRRNACLAHIKLIVLGSPTLNAIMSFQAFGSMLCMTWKFARTSDCLLIDDSV